MTPISVSQLARNDHKRGRRKSGVAIATALGLNWRDLDRQDAALVLYNYETAWFDADKKAEVTA